MKAMRSAFSWQLRGFLTAFAILVASQVIILAVGINGVFRVYNNSQLAQLETLARHILINPNDIPEDNVQPTSAFFVFSADKTLVYSSTSGRGRQLPNEDFRPVAMDGVVIGYFYTHEVQFLSSVPNRVFMISLGILIAGSMVVSFGVAAWAAVRTARRIAGSVRDLQVDIRNLATMGDVPQRELPIQEFGEMSANLREASSIIAGAEEYKRQWMQNIAHDIRTPIAGLRAQIEGMRDGVLEPTPERFSGTLAEVQRLEEMIGAMGELRSIEEMEGLEVIPIATEDLAADLRSTFEPLAARAGSTLSIACDTRAIRADRGLIMRAIGNLITNGLAHGGAGVTIDLQFNDLPEGAQIRVCNDGPGIPEDQLPRLFQRFYRGEASRTTAGAGLGLNIVQRIVQRHGGTISAENLSPRGVCFTIELPA